MATDPLPEDDPSIPEDADLWRRLLPAWYPRDPQTGTRRLTTQAFQNYPGMMAMSVLLAAEMVGPEAALVNLPGYGLGSFKAGLARQAKQRLVRMPTQEDPAHIHVVGAKSKKVQKQLRDGTTIVIVPAEG